MGAETAMKLEIEYCGSCQYYPVAAKLLGQIIRDFEPDIESVTLRPYDDGRFIVFRDGASVFDKERTNRFPDYADDIKPKLQ
jgi:selT/selW/selH-like putative selenoprotein